MSEFLVELCAGINKDRWWQDGRKWLRQDVLFPDNFSEKDLTFGADVYEYLKNTPSGNVDEYVMNHALEHFNYKEGETDGWYTTVDEILEEIFRTLKPGGKIHIEVPNIMGSAREALSGNISEEQFCNYLYGDSDYKYNVHYAGFGPFSLGRRMNKHGFVDAIIKDIGLVVVADYRKPVV